MPARKPSKLHELSGAYAKNPQRRNPDEPQCDEAIGDAPSHLTPEGQRIWSELCGMIHAGLLNRTHRAALESWCITIENFRRQYRENGGEIDPKWLVRHEKYCSLFGCSPADASRVAVPKKEKAKGFQVVS